MYKLPGGGQAAAARGPAPSRPGRTGDCGTGAGPDCRRLIFCIIFVDLVYICVNEYVYIFFFDFYYYFLMGAYLWISIYWYYVW